jgi:hypothetical protein
MMKVGDVAWNEVFQGQEDRFHGITVDSSKEKCDISVYPKKLEGSVLCSYISVSMSHTSYSEWFLNTEFTVIFPG